MSCSGCWCRPKMRRPRRRRPPRAGREAEMAVARRPHYVFPVLLIVGGAVLLLASAGAVSYDAGWRLLDLWPLILVAVGIQLVAWRLFSQPAASAIALTAIGLLAVG